MSLNMFQTYEAPTNPAARLSVMPVNGSEIVCKVYDVAGTVLSALQTGNL